MRERHVARWAEDLDLLTRARQHTGVEAASRTTRVELHELAELLATQEDGSTAGAAPTRCLRLAVVDADGGPGSVSDTLTRLLSGSGPGDHRCPVSGPGAAHLIQAVALPPDDGLAALDPAHQQVVRDAHAVAIAIAHPDIVSGGRRLQEALATLRPWLHEALDWTAPELVRIVVGGAADAPSAPSSRRAWTRLELERLLPPEFAALAAGTVEARVHPPGLTPAAFEALCARPEEVWRSGLLVRVHRVLDRAVRRLTDLDRARPDDGRGDPARSDDNPVRARQHRAWLVATGLLPRLKASQAALLRTLDDPLDAVGRDLSMNGGRRS
ncbi:MAG TPA: hypothetical protein VI248_12135 [Kineosporiaceae bacterium]